ncbi:cytochrome P450 [Dietzia alimentaria]|uniref:cytochrome P450 n=1 Tax=Dietzia alimentaria TaxID=665550 RepID=UPI00029A3696|nr:cytochrome P450 [Dietzia alimentaria]
MQPVTIPEGFDFTDPELYEKRLPHPEWAQLRKAEHVHWVQKEDPSADGFGDAGYWVVSKHADVKEVSRRTNEVFSAWENTAVPRFSPGMDRGIIEMLRFLILNQDGEEHKKHRRIISKGFTPRNVEKLRDTLAARAKKIVTDAAAKGSGDFIIEVASELPLQAIAELLGVPQEDRHQLFEWSNLMTSYDVPELADASTMASAQLLEYAQKLAADREENPQDDLITKLIQADIDGEQLSADDFGWFVILLAVAGNETTRNATTHGMIAMLDNPEQWELFKAERPETAYDEILRWASPITSFQRTATEDLELGGKQIKKGDRLALMYGSANFDEEVFEDPFTFDIRRDPNPHLTFGGQGPHYCIGANLAKLQIELIFNAIADHMPNLESLGESKRIRSGWLNGITEWPVDFKCPVAH